GLGKKVYVTVNIFAHNEDLAELPEYLLSLEGTGADALLISDFGVWNIARQVIPNMPLHVSTQANTCNWAAVQAWEKLGAERVVLARELSIEEIGEINKKCSVELEVFVHGAMCISYSGRCYLSSYLTGRDGNRGECVQSCRWNYQLIEQNRSGQAFPIEEDERGTYIMNSKDLCLLDFIPELAEAGVDSFKIEGRMKSVHYVATVVSVYRKAIDAWYANPKEFAIKSEWKDELEKVSHRPYFYGFAVNQPDENGQIYTNSSYIQTRDFVGIVLDYDKETKTAYIEQRNKMLLGEKLEALMPDGTLLEITLDDMRDENGNQFDVANRVQQVFTIKCPTYLQSYSLLRRKSK
ncbi:MAG: peptidase U32 family protein, partial [Acidaminococcaceae bacterium]